MNNEEVSRRSGRRAQPKKVKKKKSVVVIPLLLVLVLVAGGGYVFFQTHFLPTTKVNNVSIGWLNADAAEKKLTDLNQTEKIVINTGTSEETIELPKKYEIDKAYLAENIHDRSLQLPVNKEFKEELQAKLAALTFPEGTPSKNAEIQLVSNQYQIVPEETGTVVDKERLNKQIIADVEKGKGNYTYDAKDFYQLPTITKDSQELTTSLAALNNKLNKTITLDINGEKVQVSKEEIQSMMSENGTVDEAKVTAWLAEVETKYGSATQPILFTDVHGTTRKFKNNGSYGWAIDTEKAQAVVVQALNSDQAAETVTVPIAGDTTQLTKVANNYIEIDLKDQKMYCFIDGKQVVATDVITGRYNKGTATVPGFHTILYRATDVNLEGQMLDGSSYSVPVKYWMPLLSYGGVVTQIGIHDSDHKLDRFGDKEAFKTNAGSNGCINTPGTEVAKIFNVSYDGMPVIIYGNIYDDAPGEFDKPVDYGEIV